MKFKRDGPKSKDACPFFFVVKCLNSGAIFDKIEGNIVDFGGFIPWMEFLNVS